MSWPISPVRPAEMRKSLFARSGSRSDHERRYLRFNDEHRTISAQLAPESYVETKTRLHALLEEIPSEGDTPWISVVRRLHGADPLAGGDMTKKTNPFFVVAHVPLAALVEDSGHGRVRE